MGAANDRTRRRLRLLAVFLGAYLAVQPAPVGAQTTTTTPAPLIDVEGRGALLFIGLVAVGCALLWFLPLLFDVWQANKWRTSVQKEILNALAQRGKPTVEEIRQIVSALDQPPRGAAGLTQSLLALLIASMVAVALVTTLLSTAGDAGDLRKTIITSLLSVLATIAGFYFGARTAQTSTEQATRPPVPRNGPPGPPGPQTGAQKLDDEPQDPAAGTQQDAPEKKQPLGQPGFAAPTIQGQF